MKNVMFAVLLAVSMVACATSSEEAEEVVGTETSAYTTYGYCEVNPTTKTLTGKCRSGGSMCCAKVASTCVAGSVAGQVVTLYGNMCGKIAYDPNTRCQQWC